MVRTMLPESVRKGLQTDFIGKTIRHFREVTSTNDIAKELAAKGAEEGTVVIAETQTQGRGRIGRRWASPTGGIWFSTVLRPDVTPKDALRLTLTAAVAVAHAIRETLELNAEIKWPNDVLIHGRKVCGILTEMSTRGQTVDFVTLGIGINANVDIDTFPENLRASLTSLRTELKREVNRESLLQALLEELENQYKILIQQGFGQILKEWKSLAMFLGSYVEVAVYDEKLSGFATDVDHNGALLIKTQDGRIRKVTSGDVTLRKH
jgi:biotin-[acetyl-CoA-carboxylase] ligase BirA-like protein